MDIRQGCIIALGKGNRVVLLCEVKAVEENKLRLFVINGHWSLLFDMGNNKAEWCSPSGPDHREDLNIVYSGVIKGKGYNDMIHFIESMLNKNTLNRKLYCFYLTTEDYIKSTVKRFSKSCKAFKNTWINAKDYDSIPF